MRLLEKDAIRPGLTEGGGVRGKSSSSAGDVELGVSGHEAARQSAVLTRLSSLRLLIGSSR